MPCIGQPSLMLLIFFLNVISIMMTKVPSRHGTRGGVCLLLLRLYFPLLNSCSPGTRGVWCCLFVG